MGWAVVQDIILHLAMIKLEHPEYSLIAIPLFLLYIYLFVRSEKNYNRLLKVFRKRKNTSAWIRRIIIFSKLFLLVAFLILLCQPYVEKVEKKEIEYGDLESLKNVTSRIVILVDVSKSMLYNDRIKLAERFVNTFSSTLGSKDEIIVASFSRDTEVIYAGPPQNNNIELVAGKKYTAIGDALSFALSLRKASSSPVGVVLVTDGGWNYGSDPRHVALYYRSVPLAVVHVGFGLSSNPNLLREIADKSGGKFYEIDEITASVVDSLAEQLYIDLKYSALKASGKTLITNTVKDFITPQSILMVFIILLLLISLADGV